MKMTCISDLHIGGKRVKNYWEEALELAFSVADKEGKIIICAGDWFDSENISIKQVNLLYDKLNLLFKKYPEVNLYGILGNHDIPSIRFVDITKDSDVLSPLHTFNFKNLFVRVFPQVIQVKEKIFLWLFSYQPTQKLRETINKYKEKLNPDMTNILVLHTSFTGQTLPSGIEEKGLNEEDYKEFSYVVSGHIHNADSLNRKGVAVIGSPYSMRFGEGEGVITIIET